MSRTVLGQRTQHFKQIAKRLRLQSESRLPVSFAIPKPRPLTPEELIDKYPCGWMCAPTVKPPQAMLDALERSERERLKAKGRAKYLKRVGLKR